MTESTVEEKNALLSIQPAPLRPSIHHLRLHNV